MLDMLAHMLTTSIDKVNVLLMLKTNLPLRLKKTINTETV